MMVAEGFCDWTLGEHQRSSPAVNTSETPKRRIAVAHASQAGTGPNAIDAPQLPHPELRKAAPAGASLQICIVFIHGSSSTVTNLSQWMCNAQNLASQLPRGESSAPRWQQRPGTLVNKRWNPMLQEPSRSWACCQTLHQQKSYLSHCGERALNMYPILHKWPSLSWNWLHVRQLQKHQLPPTLSPNNSQNFHVGRSEELAGCVSSQWTIVILWMLHYAAQCLCPGPIALPLFDCTKKFTGPLLLNAPCH